VVDTAGKVLGRHGGLAFYTIGQRRGLGIAAAEPLYVAGKDVERNALVVGTLAELGRNALEAGGANWISGAPPAAPFRGEVKIRYSARPAPGVITPREPGGFSVRFDEPLRDITPGQAAVIFVGEEVIGQGLIRQAAFVE
jgi:tRNA-specific 2-thiouridylase